MISLSDKRYTSKSELVFEVMYDRLAQGQMKPGERFSAQEVADELEVSRTPVNEAMKKLSEYGLIKILPNVGYEVILLRWKDIEDIMRIEYLLESHGLYLRKGPFDPVLIEKLRKLNQQTIDAIARGHRQDYFRLTNAFHQEFIALADSSILQDIYTKNRHYAGWDDGKIMELSDELEQLLRQHDHALDMLEDNNIEKAVEILKHHSDDSIRLVKKSLRNSGYPGL